jgi:hypothetical protein
MQTKFSLIRAIGVEFVSRKLKSLLLVVGVGLTIVLLLAIWLTTVNIWWWLLLVPVIVVVCAAVTIYVALRLIITVLSPILTKPQRTAVSDFVDKLERVTDNLQTPMFIIIFRVLRDVVLKRRQTYMLDVVNDSTTLHSDFIRLQRNFE